MGTTDPAAIRALQAARAARRELATVEEALHKARVDARDTIATLSDLLAYRAPPPTSEPTDTNTDRGDEGP